MKLKEERLLDISLKYMNEYNNTPWYKFKKRLELKKNWYSARDLMVRINLKND